MPATAARSKKSDPQAEVFAALRKLYAPYLGRFNRMHDNDKVLYLESKTATFNKKPMFIGGVRRGKSSVSVYLMPVYCFPEMLDSISPELRKRLGGKSCFNFKKVEPETFAELGVLIKRGIDKFAKVKDFDALLKGRTYV